MRKKVVLCIEFMFAAFAHAGMVFLYNPDGSCNRGFPFHSLTADMRDPKSVAVVRRNADGTGTQSSGVISRTFDMPLEGLRRASFAFNHRLNQVCSAPACASAQQASIFQKRNAYAQRVLAHAHAHTMPTASCRCMIPSQICRRKPTL